MKKVSDFVNKRFAATRRRGFLALNFIKSTELGFSTSLS